MENQEMEMLALVQMRVTLLDPHLQLYLFRLWIQVLLV